MPAPPRASTTSETRACRPSERIQQIAAAAGWSGNVASLSARDLPHHLQQPFDWRYDLWTSTRRIREELGYNEPVSPETALERAVAWERAQLAGVERPDYAAEDVALNP